MTAYDSQGAPLPVSLYFERVASTTTDNWNVFNVATDETALFQMQFDASGKLVAPAAGDPALPLAIATPSAVTPDISATLDISKVTQYGANFAVSNRTQDSYPPDELVSLKIGEDVFISAHSIRPWPGRRLPEPRRQH